MSTPYALRKIPTYTGPCAACGITFTAHYARRICDECRPEAYRLCSLANRLVKREMRAGRLPNPWAANLVCAHCGGRASLWEHRDYSKPLEVEPTCKSCNIRRGPGARPQMRK